MRKMWGGAFRDDSNALVDAFGQSIESDLTFWREDVEASMAHARMLGKTGIIPETEADKILVGLAQILSEGPDSLPDDVEDVHTAVEVRLGEIIGETAGRLHTARSRNDQVAVDARLWLRRALEEISEEILGLQTALVEQAEVHKHTILPGVTHQQHAQPITLAFHHLALFYMLQRHRARAEFLRKTIAFSPLGSAALAGTPFPINREMTAHELGFDGPMVNALDATSDRSWTLDALHLCALVMIDLSRVSQELILWASPEFGFISLHDSVTTGSSIMPQKRNPDMAELIRGRAGRVIGHWTAMAATMKGLVLGYNRDTQEDKPPLFDSVSTTMSSLSLTTLMILTMTVNEDVMAAKCHGDFSTATDFADNLAKSGVPFREAHELTGQVIRECIDRGIGLEDLTSELLLEIAPSAPAEALEGLDPASSVARRESPGGTGPHSVEAQLARAYQLLNSEKCPIQ
jgi:argininosuccinate lyase